MLKPLVGQVMAKSWQNGQVMAKRFPGNFPLIAVDAIVEWIEVVVRPKIPGKNTLGIKSDRTTRGPVNIKNPNLSRSKTPKPTWFTRLKSLKNNHDLVTFVTMIEIHCDEKWRPCQVTCVEKFKSVLKYMYVCLRWLIRIYGK